MPRKQMRKCRKLEDVVRIFLSGAVGSDESVSDLKRMKQNGHVVGIREGLRRRRQMN